MGQYDNTKVLVTGGAGFLGSHLCRGLVDDGYDVICLDNFFTGNRRNIEDLLDSPNFELVRHDIVFPYFVEVDEIYNLACPASPVHYQHNAIKTIKANVIGATNMLGLAKRVGAKFSRPLPARSTVTRRSIRKLKIIAAMSTRWAPGPATTKASVAPRRCAPIITANMQCQSRSFESSIPMARPCIPKTVAWSPTSSFRR